MPVYRIEVSPREPSGAAAQTRALLQALREAGLPGVEHIAAGRLFFLDGSLSRAAAQRIAADVLADSLTERARIVADDELVPLPEEGQAFEIHLRPGVTDPVAESTLAELRAEGYEVDTVRTARRYIVQGTVDRADLAATVARVLANDCIERVVLGTAGVQPAPRPPMFAFERRVVPIRELDEAGLEQLARQGHLFLSLEEMQSIQAQFRELGRDPTDLELETLAQTWSEHCVHKTLKSAIVYRGAPMPTERHEGTEARRHEGRQAAEISDAGRDAEIVEIRYENLLNDTIIRATEELIAERRGPECLSVFKDNAGVIGFDDAFGVAFKVETHNHPSAIEPYGGAATGVGGCIRDVIGCGLGARPIANTDVFCVAPPDWPYDRLPTGVLHPRRVLRGVVRGVSDYGNRMGIPTVNGAICFDPRYLGNPLVYCGCVGLIPRDRVEKAARPGDLIVLIGGRTGRDGIHGATFSSAELTDRHADEFSHAVQIGNAITQKRFLDAIMRARDDESGCLYTAITDCGAGGLSSAVGEMGESVGALVDLERVPLKYAGLRYDEIWISEAQERMVLAVPRENLARFAQIMREEEVEVTVIGAFGSNAATQRRSDEGDEPRASARAAPVRPRLVVRYDGHVVGDLDMEFLHHGLPKRERVAVWNVREGIKGSGDQGIKNARADEGSSPVQSKSAIRNPQSAQSSGLVLERLRSALGSLNAASKAWVIRQYDHEVQGGSVVKPLCGPGCGPADAAVLRPRLDSQRGIAVGCGLAPDLYDVDPYWMAVASIDEALRNVICVGGDPGKTAILDNFCWGRADDSRQLGALVRACQGCCDAAKVFGVPFISGKDSLNNEFALDEGDVDAFLTTLSESALRDGSQGWMSTQALREVTEHVRETKRLSIPGTLLISALSVIEDVRGSVTPDLKSPGRPLYLIGGLTRVGASLSAARDIHAAVAAAIGDGLVRACHDCSDGGWLTALAEMAIAGDRGVDLSVVAFDKSDPFAGFLAAYIVETHDGVALMSLLSDRGISAIEVGSARDDRTFTMAGRLIPVAELRSAWERS